MKIFLAGGNGKNRIIGNKIMKVFLAGGESRHWLNAPLIEVNNDANIPCRFRDGWKPSERGQDKNIDWGGYG